MQKKVKYLIINASKLSIGTDRRRLRKGPVTRAMLRHLEANEESETPAQITMLVILSFDNSLKICKM